MRVILTLFMTVVFTGLYSLLRTSTVHDKLTACIQWLVSNGNHQLYMQLLCLRTTTW